MLYYLRLKRGVAQLGSALGSGPRGRRFESCHSDQNSGWDTRSHPEFLLMRQARESACKLLRRRTFLTRQNAICRRSAQRALGLVQNPVTPTTKKQGHLCPCFFAVGRIALCSAASSVPSQFGTKGERVKIPRCGVFTKRYPAKQRARRAEYPQATAGDYATGGYAREGCIRKKRDATRPAFYDRLMVLLPCGFFGFPGFQPSIRITGTPTLPA